MWRLWPAAQRELHLRVANVDLGRGVPTVREAKVGKGRMVPPALPLVQRLQKLDADFGPRPSNVDFFQSPHGGTRRRGAVYWIFRDLLGAPPIILVGRQNRHM